MGANLVRGLVAADHRVAVIVRPSSNLWRLRDILGQVTRLTADLTDPAATTRAVRRAHPTIIFHTATASTYGGASADDREMVRANLIATINLTQACAPLSYRCLVNTGSSSEYGPKTKPMRETDLTAPRDMYAITKCAATHYASAVARREKKPMLTFRLFTPFGPWDDPRRLMPTAIRSALAGQPINPPTFPRGIRPRGKDLKSPFIPAARPRGIREGGGIKLARPEIGRDFIYIDDVVDAYLAAIPRAQKFSGEIFNIGSGREHTLADVARAVIAATKTKSKPAWGAAPASPQDNPLWQADICKAKRLLTWRPRVSFRDGIRRTVAWLAAHH